MKNKYFLMLILLAMIFASCNSSDIRRNEISFNDSITNVQDSLLKVIPLLEKIQKPVNINKGYDYRNDKFFVNNRTVDDVSLDTIQTLSKLSNGEKKEFINITRYLHSNEINSGSYDSDLGLWLFEYRYLSEGANTDSRVIAVVKQAEITRNQLKIEVLDHKKMLYLLKFK